MRKSVIESMIWGSFAVMLVSMLIVTVVFFFSVKTSLENETYSDMHECIEHVKPLTQMSLDFSTSRMLKLYDASMKQFSHFTKYRLLVTSRSGDIIWSDADMSPSQIRGFVKQAIDKMGNKTSIKSIGLLDKVYPGRTLTVAETVTSEAAGQSWVIFCSSKAPSMTVQFFNVLLEIMLMELAALLFMAVFLYLFSNNITSPLRKINNALKEFSKGDFSRRVEYNSSNELGELARNVNIMADSVENLENMRSAFISDVSHELRTPMTSISGFVEGILDGTIPHEDSGKYLRIVLSETKRLSRLVNELLSVSRLDSGEQKINKTDFDIFELAKIVLLKFENEITAKNISVSFETDVEKCVVHADSDAYTQVLINLIHNAVKFTNDGGYIKLKLEEADDKCTFTVENSGNGIEKEKLNFIWERFYKTDISRSNDISGVGLGLYIVKKIIDAHDEKIYVSSTPNEFTRFTFTADLA